MKESLYKYILMLGDNAMMAGHRLSELCGHGPSLETDIALTNISLDFYGQVRSYFQYAAEFLGNESTEDSIAFLRTEREYLNVVLLEQPNTDFAHVITKQFLYDVYQSLLLPVLMESKDARIAAIAAKSIKESKYHLRFSSEWVKRLGAGTQESHNRMLVAVDHLLPFTGEFFVETAVEKEMSDQGIGADVKGLQESYYAVIKDVLGQATLPYPETLPRVVNGKSGMHSEHMGYILSELQYMQRTYPSMQW